MLPLRLGAAWRTRRLSKNACSSDSFVRSATDYRSQNVIRARWYSEGGTPATTLTDRRMRIHGASNKLILVGLICLIPSAFVSVKMTIPAGGNVYSKTGSRLS